MPTLCTFLISHADVSRMVRVFTAVCLSVCLFFRTLSLKPLHLGSPNLTQKCFTMSPGNPFILGSKDQSSKSRGTNNSKGVGLALW